MTAHPHLDPSPFFLPGGPVGVLLIHGFTGAPPEMRLVADYLHSHGYTVSGPLLPGHGTSLDDLDRRTWREWLAHAEGALADLRARCQMVFVGGLSMGSLLALYLASRHPELPGVIAYAPAVILAPRTIYLAPVAKYFIRSRRKGPGTDLTDPEAPLRLWSYDENSAWAAHELLKLIIRVRMRLSRVTCPLLVVHSTGDRTIHTTAGQYTYDRVASTDKELLTLHNSGHCLTVDTEWELVAERTRQFIARHAAWESLTASSL